MNWKSESEIVYLQTLIFAKEINNRTVANGKANVFLMNKNVF